MELGAKLKELRKSKGLSVYRLSDLTGLSADHIRKIERDAKVPTVETIRRYLAPLDISLSEFFYEDEEQVFVAPDEKRLIDIYRLLPKEKSKALMDFLDSFCK